MIFAVCESSAGRVRTVVNHGDLTARRRGEALHQPSSMDRALSYPDTSSRAR
jgi:hypothetical protein